MILIMHPIYKKNSNLNLCDSRVSFFYELNKYKGFFYTRALSSLIFPRSSFKNHLIVPIPTGTMHKRYTGKSPKILGQASKAAADALKASAPSPAVSKTSSTAPNESSSQTSGNDSQPVTPTEVTPVSKIAGEPPSTLTPSNTSSPIPMRDLPAVIALTHHDLAKKTISQKNASSQPESKLELEQTKTKVPLFENSPKDPDWILHEKQKMRDAILEGKMPVENKESRIKQELDRAEKNGLIDYATAGRYDAKGNPRLTQQGYNYQRQLDRLENATADKTVPSSIEEDVVQYAAGVVAIHSDTEILTPVQQHVVVTKPNQTDDGSVIGFGYLTSASGTKMGTNGVAGPQNPLIDKTIKFESSMTQGSQYCVPIIPPIIIKKGDFEETETVTAYLLDPNNPHRADQITKIDEATSKKEPRPYKTQGITVEKLQEINDLYEQCGQLKQEVIPNQTLAVVTELD